MNEVWMLDYLNGVFPQMGVFPSEETARAWVQTHDPERKDYYTPFMLTVNTELELRVITTCPERRYVRR